MIKKERENRWDQNVGVRVEHPTHVESDGNSWRDIRIPGVPGHVETLDLQLTPGGSIEGLLKEAKTGKPLNRLDLKIVHPTETQGRRWTFHTYATTDDQGRFRSLRLFPGAYDVVVNSPTLGYPLIGQAKLQVTAATQEPSLDSSVTLKGLSPLQIFVRGIKKLMKYHTSALLTMRKRVQTACRRVGIAHRSSLYQNESLTRQSNVDKALAREQAGVDHELGAGDEPGLVRGEEDDGAGEGRVREPRDLPWRR